MNRVFDGSRRADTVGRLGEERLIASLRRWLGSACPPAPAGIGDDAAVLPAAPGTRLITVDPVVFGRHFDRRVPPAAAGAKLLKRNLSDIAAMGGRPTAAVIGLLLSGDVRRAWLERFYRGLAAAALRHRVLIVGGDVAQAGGTGIFTAHLTLLGRLPGGRALTRAGAAVGDALYVTGVLGGSLPSGHHHRFEPRLAEGEWLARRPTVRAMMDISDGLAKDLRALTPRGARPAVFAAALPRRPGASVAAALTDGEDYELLFALRARSEPAGRRFEAAFRRAFPRTRLTRIGRFLPAGDALPPGAVAFSALHGYEHFRGR